MTSAGFPHSEIPGSKPVCGSPRLIAACHVLHRLSAPRHPPYTLSSLTKLSVYLSANRIALVRFSCQRTCRFLDCSGLSAPHFRRSFFESAQTKNPGGADRVRTDDLRLARAALSQLSYIPNVLDIESTKLKVWTENRLHLRLGEWAYQDSNLGPHRYQRCALTN